MANDTPAAPAPDTPAPDPASPSTDTSSTSSWPATEVGTSEAGESGPAAASTSVEPAVATGEAAAPSEAPVDESAPAAPSTAEDPATTKEELVHGADDGDAESDKDELQTPVSPTWSRSKLPVSDDDRDGGAAGEEQPGKEGSAAARAKEQEEQTTSSTDGGVTKNQATDGERVDEDDKLTAETDGEHDTPTPTESAPSRPAFFLTRPTMGGENEMISITQPSTPSIGSLADDNEPAASESLKPSIQITTFLPETKQFFASPTTTNAVPNSAVSPLTSAFFASDFTAGVRSPPRPGGAFLVELASDADVDVEVDIRRATRTTVSIDKPFTRAPPKPLSAPEHPSSSKKNRSHSPPRREDRDHRERALPPSSHRHRSRSRSREPRPTRQHHHHQSLSDSDTAYSDLDSPHVPFVHGRTVVSSAVPFLVRTESFRQQARRFARAPAPQPPREDRRREEREDRRREEREDRRREVRDRENRPREDRQREDRPREDRHREDRRREDRARDERRRDDGPPPLARVLEAVKQALRHDPAAYYALKGVLAEYEERTTRVSPHADSRRRSEDESRRAGPRDERELRKIRLREKREKRIPVELGLAQSSGSETEVERVEKVRARDAGGKVPRFDDEPAGKLRKHRRAADPPRRNSPTPPCYPSHLSSPHSARATGEHDVVRPIPVYPPSHTRPRDFSPRPAQTLTLAQAAKLASGLGDERQAEKLRRSGLSGREKVTRLEGREDEPRKEERRDETRREERREKSRKEEKTERRRRHSFDSVVDYKPASDKAPTLDVGGRSKASKDQSGRKDGDDKDLKLEHRKDVPALSSSTKPPRKSSTEQALRFSIVDIRMPSSQDRPDAPPLINVDLIDIDKHRPRGSKGKGKGKAREAMYDSPTTRTAPQAASHFHRSAPRATSSVDRYAPQAGRGDSISFDFDDFA
ncbi:hypothetical protein JCM10449v2_001151 [Rhodotorula kratochvilovae]